MKRKTSGEVTQKKVVRRMGVVDKAKTPQKLGVCFVRGHNRVVMLGKRRLCTKWTTSGLLYKLKLFVWRMVVSTLLLLIRLMLMLLLLRMTTTTTTSAHD